MKNTFILSLAFFTLQTLQGQQTTSDSTKNHLDIKVGEPGANPDTIRVGGITIIKKKDENAVEKKELKINYPQNKDAKKKDKKISTNWWVMDIGVSQFTDKTDYTSSLIQNPTNGFAPGATKDWLKLRNGKSINVNIWFYMRKANLISHVINLKYAFGMELNNYRLSNPVIFQANPTKLTYVPSSVNSFSKNKFSADYLTIPLMLNINFSPNEKKGVALSAGMSVGYLFNSKEKTISSANGKQKFHDSFDLEPWKVSYVGELKLGGIKLYGSAATKSMFSKGLDLTPYNVGFRFSN